MSSAVKKFVDLIRQLAITSQRFSPEVVSNGLGLSAGAFWNPIGGRDWGIENIALGNLTVNFNAALSVEASGNCQLFITPREKNFAAFDGLEEALSELGKSEFRISQTGKGGAYTFDIGNRLVHFTFDLRPAPKRDGNKLRVFSGVWLTDKST